MIKSAIVIMYSQYYIEEVIRQLSSTNFYEQMPSDVPIEVIHRINLYIHDMYSRGQMTRHQLI